MHIFDLTTPNANKILHVLYNNQEYRAIYGDIQNFKLHPSIIMNEDQSDKLKYNK